MDRPVVPTPTGDHGPLHPNLEVLWRCTLEQNARDPSPGQDDDRPSGVLEEECPYGGEDGIVRLLGLQLPLLNNTLVNHNRDPPGQRVVTSVL